MNTYKVKTFNLIKRLSSVAKRKSSRKISQTSNAAQLTQPCVNNLYAIDFLHQGTLQKNIIARYAGKSKSGRFFNFELSGFYTTLGIKISMLCLNLIPAKIRPVKQHLFNYNSAKAA